MDDKQPATPLLVFLLDELGKHLHGKFKVRRTQGVHKAWCPPFFSAPLTLANEVVEGDSTHPCMLATKTKTTKDMTLLNCPPQKHGCKTPYMNLSLGLRTNKTRAVIGGHRLVLLAMWGPSQHKDKSLALHVGCSNKNCWNPYHLAYGDHKENATQYMSEEAMDEANGVLRLRRDTWIQAMEGNTPWLTQVQKDLVTARKNAELYEKMHYPTSP
jgi:hypothetical protein